MDTTYTKITVLSLLFAFLLICFDAIIYPYASAYSETKKILVSAGIPIEKKAEYSYREQAVSILREKCSTGFYEESQYEFHCIVNSPVSYWGNELISNYDEQIDAQKGPKVDLPE